MSPRRPQAAGVRGEAPVERGLGFAEPERKPAGGGAR
jgi:hypothetical protein